jgi:hypothetical protein
MPYSSKKTKQETLEITSTIQTYHIQVKKVIKQEKSRKIVLELIEQKL